MTRIFNPVALEPDENTFISALAFATGTGVLSATRNDGVELTESLDGRYVTANDYVSSASFNTGNGVLKLTRTDTGTVTVDLDGRYITTDVYLSSASFATDSGVLTLTLSTNAEVTVDLDGRYSTNDTFVNAASFDSGTRVLTLTLNDASTVTVTISESTDTNTFVNAASFDSDTGTLTLTRNDAATVTSDLDGRYVPFKDTVGVVTDLDDLITTQVHVCDKSASNRPIASSSNMDVFTISIIKGSDGGSQFCVSGDADSSDNQAWIRMWKDNAGSYTWTDWAEIPTSATGNFVPFDLTIPSPSYALNDYTTTGIYSVDKNATNIPTDMPSWIDELVLHVTQSGGYNGTQTLYTANGTATSEFGRIYYRKWEDSAGINWSPWTEINVGGISGDLKTSYAAIDLDSATYRETGYWALGAKGAATSWPSDLSSTSDYNILQTIRSGSTGAGQQKIMCAYYDAPSNLGTHIQEWKRVFDLSNETDWFEYQFQGLPITKEVYKTTLYDFYTHGNNPDTSNTRAYYVTLSGHSMSLYGFSGGYREGQLIRIFRETNDTTVTIYIYANSYYATQPIYLRDGGTSLTLTSYQSAEFIFHNNIWFQQY
tara:strand:- start:3735 stop:5534 length:1800 start_codon:yes stop_codon:yes gene_type:complete